MAAILDQRLDEAIEWSIKRLAKPREERIDTIKQFVGSHYADGDSAKNVPINLLELAVTIYLQNLAARAPRVMVTTSVDTLKPFAKSMALALNQVPDEIKLGDTLRHAVLEALFGIGVVKVGLTASGRMVGEYDPGEVFVDLVTYDDYFVDMTASTRKEIQYEGNEYWLDLRDARDMLGESGKKLEADPYKTDAWGGGTGRADEVSSAEGGKHYEDKIRVRDVWLSSKQELVTYAVTTKTVLRRLPWDGPKCGPYHVLAFNDVPGNLLPLPPTAILKDLHKLANVLMRKLATQAQGKKTVVLFGGGNDAAAKRLKKAKDGEGLQYDGPDPRDVEIGGVDPQILAFMLQVRDMLNYQGGNLDLLGGLAPVTETVGQDKLLSQGASARMQRMVGARTDFVRGVFKSIAWYEWTDPIRERMVEKRLEGSDSFVVRTSWSAETRDGDFLDYNLDIDPFSMTADSPETRLQKLRQFLSETVLPIYPEIQRQGGSIDFRKLFDVFAELGNLDVIRELIVFGEPIEGDPQQGGDPMPSFKPAHTTRTYERVNRPGATRHGKDDAMTRLLMGSGVQGAEAAAIGRPST